MNKKKRDRKLADWMVKNGITTAEFAKRTRSSHNTVSQWRKGVQPKPPALRRIQSAYPNCPLAQGSAR